MRSIEQEALAANRRAMGRSPSSRGGAAGRAVAQSDAKKQEAARTREAEKAERARTALFEKAERDRTRAAAAEARKRHQAEVSLQRQRSAALMRQYKLEESARARAESDVKRTTRGVLSGTAGRVASVGRGAVAMSGLAGGAIFAAGVHGAMKKQAAASDLANQLLGNDATVESLAAKKKEILATVGQTRGFAAEDVIAGMSRFQGTAGEGAATMKMAPVLTQMSLATGASMEDLGDMFASMYAAIKNAAGGSEKSVEEIIAETEKLGRVFGAMGQVGAIELKDIASAGSEITATALSYEGDVKKNIQDVAALMQIARQTGGAASAPEASTAVQNFVNDLVNKQDKVNKYLQQKGGSKASLYADKSQTKLKSLDKLIPELMAATGGDLEKMSDILGIRGAKSLKGFSEPYQEAYQKAKKEKKSEKQAIEEGKKAVTKRQKEFAGIEMSKEEVAAKAASRLADADKLLEENMRKLTDVAGKELLPVITQLIPELAKLVPYVSQAANAFVNLAKFLTGSPLTGLASIIGLSFAAEMAKAEIGKRFEAILSRLTGAPGNRPPTDAEVASGETDGRGPRKSNILGAGATGLALGAAAYAGISYEGRTGFDASRAGTNEVMKSLAGLHGSELGSAIVEAEARIKAIEAEAGLFGKFLDVFGAGSGGEIESARKMVAQKRSEYDEFRATGKLTQEQMEDMELRKQSTGATEKLTTAINTLTTALPSVSINTSNKPTTPAVK